MRRTLLVLVLTAMLAASVGAVPRAVSIRWQPSPTPGVVGYRVYVRQVTDAAFAPPLEVGLPTPANDGTMSATLTGYDDGVDWVFALSAVGTGNDESGLSNPITLGGTGTGSTITTTSTTTSTTVPVPCNTDDECDDSSACTADDRCASGFCAWDSIVCPVASPAIRDAAILPSAASSSRRRPGARATSAIPAYPASARNRAASRRFPGSTAARSA